MHTNKRVHPFRNTRLCARERARPPPHACARPGVFTPEDAPTALRGVGGSAAHDPTAVARHRSDIRSLSARGAFAPSRQDSPTTQKGQCERTRYAGGPVLRAPRHRRCHDGPAILQASRIAGKHVQCAARARGRSHASAQAPPASQRLLPCGSVRNVADRAPQAKQTCSRCALRYSCAAVRLAVTGGLPRGPRQRAAPCGGARHTRRQVRKLREAPQSITPGASQMPPRMRRARLVRVTLRGSSGSIRPLAHSRAAYACYVTCEAPEFPE